MSNITIEDVTRIIFNIKEKHNIQDKNFEIFALAAVLDELKIDDFDNLSLLRTSGDKYEEDYAFQINLPAHGSTFARFDKDDKKFYAIYDRNGNKSNAHAVHTDEEMEILKDIYNVFEKNEYFDDFKADFINNLSQKIDNEYSKKMEKLYGKSFDFSKITFLKHLKEVMTIDTLTDRIDKTDIALNLFKTGLARLHTIKESDYSPEDGMHTAVSKESIDDRLHSSHFGDVIKFDNLVGHSKTNHLNEDDIIKVKELLKSDYVKNNTISGIIMNDDLQLSEKLFKIVGLHYDELRDDFIDSFENVTMLKTREQMSANFHINEIKSTILEEFPTAFNEKDLKLVKSITIGEFTHDENDASQLYREYLNSLKPFGLIRGVDLVTNNHADLNDNMFFEESYSQGKLVTLKSANEVETLYQYTFKEFDVYGVKLLEPKDVYISKELGHGRFLDSINDMIKYAKEKNCIIVTSETIDDSQLLGHFDDHLCYHGYENIAFYDRNLRKDKNYLNISLGLQKEFGTKMPFDAHIKIKNLVNEDNYISDEDLIQKAKKIINTKKEKKSKINGPN